MPIFLPTTREILELPTQTEADVFRMTHLGAVLGFKFEPIAEMEMTVEGGDVFSDRRGIKTISSAIMRDELGRPIVETVVNEDKGETTTRRWEYTSPDDASEYTSWIEETEEGRQSNHVVGKGRILAHRNDRDFFVQQATSAVGNSLHILSDAYDQPLQLVVFDKDGRLRHWTLIGESRTTTVQYQHDAEGRVHNAASKVTKFGLGTDEEKQEDLTLVTYFPTFVTVRNYAGMTTVNRSVRITCNESGQPVSIREVRGFPETGLRTTEVSVKYHELAVA